MKNSIKRKDPSILTKAISMVLACTIVLGNSTFAFALPTAGKVKSGKATISVAGKTMTVKQFSQDVSLAWSSFNIGKYQTVNFLQPNSSSVALNFISTASLIGGKINANGQVFLMDPFGIIFGKNAQINVAGLVAGGMSLDSWKNGVADFSGTGNVVNEGTITTAPGGYIALVGQNTSNTGTMSSRLGTVAMAAGNDVSLDFTKNSLININVDKNTLKSTVDNSGVIGANGGKILLSAGAKDSLVTSAVNNTGIIDASSVGTDKGKVSILAGMKAGTVSVSGTIDANGSALDTSASSVRIAKNVQVFTGTDGSWLIDPTSYYIGGSSPDITGSQLDSLLASNNITISSTQGSGGTNGNIYVDSNLNWSNNTLTLKAYNDILFNNSTIDITGTGALKAYANDTAAFSVGSGNGTISMSGSSISAPSGTVEFFYNPSSYSSPTSFSGVSAGTFIPYLYINSLADLENLSSTQTSTTLANSYALNNNIGWSSNTAYNFTPIGSVTTPFTGYFDGMGHTINNLYEYNPGTLTGLFGLVDTPNATSGISSIRDISLTNIDILNTVNSTSLYSNSQYSGGLVGVIGCGNCSSTQSANEISYASVSGSLSDTVNVSGANTNGTYMYTGGLVGATESYSNINNISSNVSVTANINGSSGQGPMQLSAGGLAGATYGTITNAFHTGAVTTSISNYAASGTSSCVSEYAGGIVGEANGNITNSDQYATLNALSLNASFTTSGAGTSENLGFLGGLVGSGSNISNSFSNSGINSTASGTGISTSVAGGLIGSTSGSISNSFVGPQLNASGNWQAPEMVAVGSSSGSGVGSFGGKGASGGFIGYENGGSVTNTYAYASEPSEPGVITGGYIGFKGQGTFSNNFWNTTVGGTADIGGYYSSTSGYVYSPETISGISGLTTSQMASSSNFTGFSFGGTPWQMYAFQSSSVPNLDLPTLSDLSPTVGGDISRNTITKSTPNSSFYALTLNASKTYDGTTSVTTTEVAQLLGLSPTDSSVSLSGNFTSGTYSSSNVGNNISVSGLNGSFSLSGSDASMYVLAPLPSVASITPAPLTVSTVASKTYDGNNSITLNGSDTTLNGFVSGQGASITSPVTGTFSTDNVGSNLGGILSLSSSNTTENSGTLLSNYSLPTTFSGGSITPATLTLTGMTANNKVYDGTDSATLSSLGTLSGLVSGQTLTLNGPSSVLFSSPNVGNNKTVSVDGFFITNGSGLASNYTLVPNWTTTADITPAPLSVYFNNPTKTENGNTSISLNSSNVDISGFVSGQNGVLNDIGTFETSQAGSNIPVSANITKNNFVLDTNTQLSNYSFPTYGSGFGTILPKDNSATPSSSNSSSSSSSSSTSPSASSTPAYIPPTTISNNPTVVNPATGGSGFPTTGPTAAGDTASVSPDSSSVPVSNNGSTATDNNGSTATDNNGSTATDNNSNTLYSSHKNNTSYTSLSEKNINKQKEKTARLNSIAITAVEQKTCVSTKGIPLPCLYIHAHK